MNKKMEKAQTNGPKDRELGDGGMKTKAGNLLGVVSRNMREKLQERIGHLKEQAVFQKQQTRRTRVRQDPWLAPQGPIHQDDLPTADDYEGLPDEEISTNPHDEATEGPDCPNCGGEGKAHMSGCPEAAQRPEGWFGESEVAKTMRSQNLSFAKAAKMEKPLMEKPPATPSMKAPKPLSAKGPSHAG